jgi:chromosome partitioning protein
MYRMENDFKSYEVFAYNWNQPKPEVNFEKAVQLSRSKFDVVLLDVPGKMEGPEVYWSLMLSNAVMIPIVASQLDINSTIAFLKKVVPTIQQHKHEQGRSPLEVFGVINKKDQTIEHSRLKDLSGISGLNLFYSPLSNRVRYRRYVSTVHDIADPHDKEDEFNQYFDEFMTKCL